MKRRAVDSRGAVRSPLPRPAAAVGGRALPEGEGAGQGGISGRKRSGRSRSSTSRPAKPANEKIRPQLEGPLAFYRGVCEANSGNAAKAQATSRRTSGAQPNASIDEKMYSKKAVAAFAAAEGDRVGRAVDRARVRRVPAARQLRPSPSARLGRRPGAGS